MKTPEEFKKNLVVCMDEAIEVAESGDAHDLRDFAHRAHARMSETLTYIQQLEAELAAVERERDALSKDLKAACKLLWSDDSMQCCKFCEHENEPKDTGYCDKCCNGNRFKFKPAALCPDTEVQEDV